MKTYRINYYYDGTGYAIVKAENKKQAKDFYNEGNAFYHDDGDNYCFESIEEEK